MELSDSINPTPWSLSEGANFLRRWTRLRPLGSTYHTFYSRCWLKSLLSSVCNPLNMPLPLQQPKPRFTIILNDNRGEMYNLEGTKQSTL